MTLPEALFDKHGYPSKCSLKVIVNWCPSQCPIEDILAFMKSLWNHDYGSFNLKGHLVLKLHLATGGWSGNESIINAVDRNTYLHYGWQKSERGGAHWYKWDTTIGLYRSKARKKPAKPA
jgi:hypothetical protein